MRVYPVKRSHTQFGRLTHHSQSIFERGLLSFTPSLPPRLVQLSSIFDPSLGCCDTRLPSSRRTCASFTMSSQAKPSASTLACNGKPEQPWYAAYPEARSRPTPISCTEVLGLLKEGNEGAKVVLVDLRRTDYEVSLRHTLIRSHSHKFHRGAPSTVLSTCPLKACTRLSLHSTISSTLPVSVALSGTAVC